MNDLPVYMIVNLNVTDADTYRIYEKGFFGLLKKYDGQFVTFDDDPVTFEGCAPRPVSYTHLTLPTKRIV